MPYYEYQCDACGPFMLLRPLSECSSPVDCPDCHEQAQKIFPVVNLRNMSPTNRIAWERNEKSTHAPHVCSSGCSHKHKPAKPKPKQKDGRPALEMSTKKNRRPWMLGH